MWLGAGVRVWGSRWALAGLSRKLFAVQSQVRPHYTRGRVSGGGGGGGMMVYQQELTEDFRGGHLK